MSTPRIPQGKIYEVIRLGIEGIHTRDAIAKLVGISAGSVSKILAGKMKPNATESPSYQHDEDGNNLRLNGITENPIKTIEEAVLTLGIDLTVWEIVRFKCSPWTVPVVVGAAGHKELVQTQQYSVSLEMRRLIPKNRIAAVESLLDRLRDYAPKYHKLKKPKGPGDPALAVFGLFDIHFGKLAWKPECGRDYDLAIATEVTKNAVHNLINRSVGMNIEKILLPLGNDWLHVDGPDMMTTAGTPMDCDGRWAKIVDAAEATAIWAVETLSQIAPVDVVCVPGNHDVASSQWLCRIIKAAHHNNPNVKVTISPAPRVYYDYGVTLLGLVHGDKGKPDSFHGLMASECPEKWSTSKCREWLCGHKHRSLTFTTKAVDQYQGTIIRYLRCLCATDAWHVGEGYIGNELTPAAEVYWYDKVYGYAGHAVVPSFKVTK